MSLALKQNERLLPTSFPQIIFLQFLLFEAVLFNWTHLQGFPVGSDGKESAHYVGDPGSILGLGRSPGEGDVYPLPYSCLENSMDRGAWQAIVHGIAESQTRLCDFTFFLYV